jgi:KDO2-lipid IV(A) lauroyltransferase
MASDRDLQGNGVWVPFLGKPAPVPPGAAVLAIRTGASLLPCFCAGFRDTNVEVFIEAPLDTAGSGSLEDRALTITATLAQVSEDYIRRYPDQWYVLSPV